MMPFAHWFFHATRHWTDGQVAVTILGAETVFLLAAHTAGQHIRAARARRHRPARRLDLDGAQRRRHAQRKEPTR